MAKNIALLSHGAGGATCEQEFTYPEPMSPRSVNEAVSQLEQIIAGGGPEQQTQARTLMHCIEDAECDKAMMEQVAALYEAYLNDPYLTR